jgi:hypothetical protein
MLFDKRIFTMKGNSVNIQFKALDITNINV